jgi:uncharacterized protein YndB with AHSA1/START domain
MSTSTTDLVVRKSILVDATPEEAWRVFTEDSGTWWPFATFAIMGDESNAAVFEPRSGGRVYERTPDGREADWGRVLTWEPPARLVMEWGITEPPTEVEVRFTPEASGTRLELEHRGFGGGGGGNYDAGWEHILGLFADRVSGSA